MAVPGWYDDPQGGGGQRWWDGERWSEHTTPPPTAVPPPPPGAGPAGARGGSGKLIGSILALVLVAAIGGVVAFVLMGDDPPGTGASIAAGDQRAFEVPENGEWELVIEVPAGLLVIDARGEDGFDPVAQLQDAGGQQIDRNDDRSSDQLDRYGGEVFDSLIEREVPAGTYRVVITGFAGQGGSGQVGFPIVGG